MADNATGGDDEAAAATRDAIPAATTAAPGDDLDGPILIGADSGGGGGFQPILLAWEAIGLIVPLHHRGCGVCFGGKRFHRGEFGSSSSSSSRISSSGSAAACSAAAVAGSSSTPLPTEYEAAGRDCSSSAEIPSASAPSDPGFIVSGVVSDPVQGQDHCLLVLDDVSGFAGQGALSKASGQLPFPLPPRPRSKAGVDKLTKAGAAAAKADNAPAVAEGGAGGHTWRGSVTAIMGPSGAGKTSLLSVLSGRCTGRVTGSVRINGACASAETVRGVSGYVAQEDVLPETLTCFEHLMFHATLRMTSYPIGGGGGVSGHRRGVVSREARKGRVLEVSLGRGTFLTYGVYECWPLVSRRT